MLIVLLYTTTVLQTSSRCLVEDESGDGLSHSRDNQPYDGIDEGGLGATDAARITASRNVLESGIDDHDDRQPL